MKKILDVTCGSRTMWFNKNHPAAVYCDKRNEEFTAIWKSTKGFIVFDTHERDEVKLMRVDYGKTWRCWSRRPTDEERKAAKWDE